MACSKHWILSFALIIAFLPLSFLEARQNPDYAMTGMVTSAEPFATAAGFEIMAQGGNAADAAVAVGFALAVTFPNAGNIGGGGFLVYRAPDGTVSTLDYREKGPGAATAGMFLDHLGEPDPHLSRRSLLASGVPGSVAGLLEIHSRWGSGKLTRAQVMAPAIRLAEQGFPVSFDFHESLINNKERLGGIESTALVLYPDGDIPAPGSIFRQPGLAATLKEIAIRGRDGFYTGWVADSLVALMSREGGLITHDDLTSYQPVERKPITFRFRDKRIFSMGPPSSGGIVLAQMLGLLEPMKLKELGHNSAAYTNRLVETERLAYADRNHWLGDIDFTDIPLEGLLSARYIDSRRRLMPIGRAGSSNLALPGRAEHMETTHYCVVDSMGGAAAITTTLNGGYGNGWVVPGAGFFLNNEMDDFSVAPGRPNMFGLVQGNANKIEPGKRMLSSMTPTIVTTVEASGEEKLLLVAGAAGGPTITTTTMQIILNTTVFGMNVRQAVDAARFHHQHLPDVITIETNTFSAGTAGRLMEMGYQFRQWGKIGSASAIMAVPGGWLSGWSDGVGAGAGTGWK
jgi:gamma-glutamyltranspeptidase / glutathione hydrolase